MSQSIPAGTPVTHRPVLQAELDNIRANVVELTKQVEVAIERAIWGLRERNPDICTAVIEGDAAINEQHRKIRDACFHAILTQALTYPAQTVSVDDGLVRGIRAVVLVDQNDTERARITA